MAENENGVGVGELAIGDNKQVVVEAPEAIPEINALESPDGYGHVVAVRDGYTLETLDGRDEGRRIHEFDDIKTFAAYLKRHATGDQTEILLGEKLVRAAMDPKAPRPEIIDCSLNPHPTFAAWTEAFNKPLSQRDFHALVRGFRSSVQDADGILQALRVMSVGKKGEVQSEIDETGATRLNLVSERVTMAATVQPEFVLLTPVYRGVTGEAGEELDYPIEILVNIDVEHFQFAIQAPALELVKEQARKDVAGMLSRELGESFLVGLGDLEIVTRNVYETEGGSE